MSLAVTEESVVKKTDVIGKDTVIEIKNLFKSFGENNVLKDFSFSLHRGENVAVLGQSGSGKSVLIKCIIGLIAPDSGTLRVFGQDINELGHESLDELRERVGFLFQSNALYDSMTIRENLEFPLRRHHLVKSKDEATERIEKALQDVGLLHTIDLMPAELSGGMRKRIGVARTLILRPEIILYDEPTTGLDPITARGIGELMNAVHNIYNTSSIIISHDLSLIRLTAHRIVLLMDGTNYAEGTYEDLKNCNDIRIKAFFE